MIRTSTSTVDARGDHDATQIGAFREELILLLSFVIALFLLVDDCTSDAGETLEEINK